jgi:uncharacterized membrane protein
MLFVIIRVLEPLCQKVNRVSFRSLRDFRTVPLGHVLAPKVIDHGTKIPFFSVILSIQRLFSLIIFIKNNKKRMRTNGLSISALALFVGSGGHAFSPILTHAARRMTTTKSFRVPQFHMTKNDLSELHNPTPILVSFLENLKTNNTANSMKVATAMMAFALTFLPLNAEAAMSGGRMGGSFSSSRPSMSRPSSSYNRGYSSGYTSGYNSRPRTTIITPGVGFGYNPYAMSPVMPYYGGGPGVISYNRGPGLFEILFFGGTLFTVANILSNAGRAVNEDDIGDSRRSSFLGAGTSVVQMSVALEVPNRDDPNSILSVLDRLAQTARTDSRVGIQNLTSQVALELLRRRSSIASATSSYQHFRDPNKASREYQAISVNERSKFEQELVSKFGGVDYSLQKGTNKPTLESDKATMAVVTIILSAYEDSATINVPKINSISDVEDALRKIASDAKADDFLQSAEILWTPEDRTETLTRADVIADYPELRSV